MITIKQLNDYHSAVNDAHDLDVCFKCLKTFDLEIYHSVTINYKSVVYYLYYCPDCWKDIAGDLFDVVEVEKQINIQGQNVQASTHKVKGLWTYPKAQDQQDWDYYYNNPTDPLYQTIYDKSYLDKAKGEDLELIKRIVDQQIAHEKNKK